ncbi:MAG: hypothetical protein HYV04_17705 [Deltaproteobacteria bacterium]|nr:hypothetical protein [Deltaproteobacteria bacterium]
MKEKLFWLFSGAIVFFVLFVLFGGLYTITAPNGTVDVAYKMNRLTGRVWLIKTYSKQVGPVRVLAAREAMVEKTKDFSEADISPVAAQEPSSVPRRR